MEDDLEIIEVKVEPKSKAMLMPTSSSRMEIRRQVRNLSQSTIANFFSSEKKVKEDTNERRKKEKEKNSSEEEENDKSAASLEEVSTRKCYNKEMIIFC